MRADVADGIGVQIQIVAIVHAGAHEMAVSVVKAGQHGPPLQIDGFGRGIAEGRHILLGTSGKDGLAVDGQAGNDGTTGIHSQDDAVTVNVRCVLLHDRSLLG